MFFIAETKKDPIVKAFYENAKKYMIVPRFGVAAMDIALQERKDAYRIVMMAKPLITNTSLYMALFVLIPAVIFGWGFAGMLIPFLLVLVRVFETDYFGFVVLRFGLRKKGYKDSVTMVSYAQLVEEAITHGTKRNN